jgi:hypothetical protein
MSSLSHNFNKLADQPVSRNVDDANSQPPFSIRFTFAERARLDEERGSKSLGAYIRHRLFGKDAGFRRKPGNSPIKDAAALGRVLGALGASRLSSNLNQLAKAVHLGTLPVTPETEADLVEACREIQEIRLDLLRALGKLAGPPG